MPKAPKMQRGPKKLIINSFGGITSVLTLSHQFKSNGPLSSLTNQTSHQGSMHRLQNLKHSSDGTSHCFPQQLNLQHYFAFRVETNQYGFVWNCLLKNEFNDKEEDLWNINFDIRKRFV